MFITDSSMIPRIEDVIQYPALAGKQAARASRDDNLRMRARGKLRDRLATRQARLATASLEIAAARAMGRDAGYAEAGETLRLCQDAGEPGRVREFLASGSTPEETQETLLEGALAKRKRAQIAARKGRR